MKTTFHSFEIYKREMKTPDKTIKLFKQEPEIHHDFNCKKTIFNDVDADALFSSFAANIIKGISLK